MNPVIRGTLVGDADGDGDILDDLGLANSISGIVALADGVTFPICEAGGQRSVTDFIPTATANGIVDSDGQPMVWSGTVAEDGSYLIGFLPQGTYTMGFVEAITLGEEELAFEASVSLYEVTMTGSDVGAVNYTVTTSTCN